MPVQACIHQWKGSISFFQAPDWRISALSALVGQCPEHTIPLFAPNVSVCIVICRAARDRGA